MKVFCYLTTLQKSYMVCQAVGLLLYMRGQKYTLIHWTQTVIQPGIKNSCGTIFTLYSWWCEAHFVCFNVSWFVPRSESLNPRLKNMSFTWRDVRKLHSHVYKKQMSDPHVTLFHFSVHMRHFREGTSTFLFLRVPAEVDTWLLVFTIWST